MIKRFGNRGNRLLEFGALQAANRSLLRDRSTAFRAHYPTPAGTISRRKNACHLLRISNQMTNKMPSQLMLTNYSTYLSTYSLSYLDLELLGDINVDGAFDNGDMQALIYLIQHGG